MAYLYDYRNFNQFPGELISGQCFDAARQIARARKHSVVVEDGDDYYRVTPKGRKLPMPSWFMPATLGGKP